MFSENSIQKLNTILKDFYKITKVRIAVFDENFSIATAYPEDKPLFCKLIQSKAPDLCLNCDKNAMQYAAKEKKLYIYRCHAGLTECVMPIFTGIDNPVGYIMLGHMRAAEDNCEEIMVNQGVKYRTEKSEIINAIAQLNILDKEYISSVAHISQFLASYILTEKIYTLTPDDIPLKVANYLHENFKNNITVKELSQKFGVGKTTLYKLFTEKYEMGVSTYLRKIRLEHAKELLINTQNISISEICEKCGFEDYNYFIVLFKKEFGMSPKAYAKKR